MVKRVPYERVFENVVVGSLDALDQIERLHGGETVVQSFCSRRKPLRPGRDQNGDRSPPPPVTSSYRQRRAYQHARRAAPARFPAARRRPRPDRSLVWLHCDGRYHAQRGSWRSLRRTAHCPLLWPQSVLLAVRATDRRRSALRYPRRLTGRKRFQRQMRHAWLRGPRRTVFRPPRVQDQKLERLLDVDDLRQKVLRGAVEPLKILKQQRSTASTGSAPATIASGRSCVRNPINKPSKPLQGPLRGFEAKQIEQEAETFRGP